jgi:hypothetical protein
MLTAGGAFLAAAALFHFFAASHIPRCYGKRLMQRHTRFWSLSLTAVVDDRRIYFPAFNGFAVLW